MGKITNIAKKVMRVVSGTFDFYLKCVVEVGFFTALFSAIDKSLKKLNMNLFRHFFPIEENKVVFLTFDGSYDCNPKWIAEEMISRGIKAQYIWGIREGSSVGADSFPKEIKTVQRERYLFFKHLASAKIIVDNGINTSYLGYKVKGRQVLIQTWHGSLGIKRFDAETNKNRRWVKKARKEGKMTRYAISNSAFEDEVYRNSFWNKCEIWRFGHARNDILFRVKGEDAARLRKKILERYAIPPDSRFCLYAPTFRDDGDSSPYAIDYGRLRDTLKKRFGGEWVILTRFHFRVREQLRNYDFVSGVYNVSDYIDIQELMCVIDVGITDYSSWICEYVLRRMPGFLFATDADSYEKSDRKFFFPLEYLPFPVARSEAELLERIQAFDEIQYIRKCDRFLGEMGSVDDGHAAKRIVDRIEGIMGK